MLPGHAHVRARAQFLVFALVLFPSLIPARTYTYDEAAALRELLELEFKEGALSSRHSDHELVHHLPTVVRYLLGFLPTAGDGRELAVELDGGGVLPALHQTHAYKVLAYGD